ncbi:hypothetical protein CXG81DRAFT_21260 [Caulochytrium protostelioides]|uniref:Uncharacterized protein n=1 Tax=Caulochytrium protostelioides TaxID=1555241 RepID=A0A4P9WYC8_9FUNG|nr:hypothetical protein CXG81DRAFT_21260 [Caulochytrium protostelioides]|eukprot:RKO98519.1 hypothetical protein CXG81DRAFT_21260 [Caulochytrium protostelioides]
MYGLCARPLCRPLARAATAVPYRTFYTYHPAPPPASSSASGAAAATTTTTTESVVLDDGSVLLTRPSVSTSLKDAALAKLPPPVRPIDPAVAAGEVQAVLPRADVALCRRLRSEDPQQWTVAALAARFNTTPLAILRATSAQARDLPGAPAVGGPVFTAYKQSLAQREDAAFERASRRHQQKLLDRVRAKATW